MGLPVLSHQASAVNAKHYMQALNAHIVEQHVIPSLQEGRIDRQHRHRPLLGHPGGHCDSVPLCNPYIKIPVRMAA